MASAMSSPVSSKSKLISIKQAARAASQRESEQKSQCPESERDKDIGQDIWT